MKKQWVKISNSDWTGAIPFSLRRLHVPEHQVQIERYRYRQHANLTANQCNAARSMQENNCKQEGFASIKTLPNSRINMIQLYKQVFRARFSADVKYVYFGMNRLEVRWYIDIIRNSLWNYTQWERRIFASSVCTVIDSRGFMRMQEYLLSLPRTQEVHQICRRHIHHHMHM